MFEVINLIHLREITLSVDGEYFILKVVVLDLHQRLHLIVGLNGVLPHLLTVYFL
jgi:hypothetical protein